MRILLRDTRTGLFFQPEDKWTRQIGAAKDFGSSSSAVVLASQRGLSDVEIVMDFDDPRYNITLLLAER